MKKKLDILNSIPVRDKQILFRKEDNKTILLDNRTGQPFILNETGTSIWEKIDGKNNLLKIIQLLKNEFVDTQNSIEEDVLNLIKKLSKNKMLFFKK